MDLKNVNYEFSKEFNRIKTLEMHTGGEPLRIAIDGLPKLMGDSILAQRKDFKNKHDHIRKALIFEPRGHADMYAAIITQGFSKEADFGTFFLHNEGYSTMCGHAIIALTKFVIETGLIKKEQEDPELIIDAPPGVIHAKAHMKKGKVVRTSFLNVPSFVLYANETIYVDGVGELKFDLAYGGAFYAIINAESLHLSLDQKNVHQLIEWGKKIKLAIIEKFPVNHPFEEDLSFLYGCIFTGKADNPSNHSKNVCIFANGEVDRSATGSGVSARAALHHFKGELALGQSIRIESILGTCMDVKIASLTEFGPFKAVIPKVSGSAHFCGQFELWIDPEDPLKEGFILR